MGTPDRTADWWTTTDVAAYLGVTVSTVSAYRSRQQMPAPDRTIGRTHVWTPARIIEWNESRPGHGGRPPDDSDRRLEHAEKNSEETRSV